jgi:hypothetical protein
LSNALAGYVYRTVEEMMFERRTAPLSNRASDLNINPDGGVMDPPLNWRHMKRLPADLSNRLLGKEEVDTRLEVLGH